jgi:hypothetical protein
MAIRLRRIAERGQRSKTPLIARSCKVLDWRARADEDGHYCFAVAL